MLIINFVIAIVFFLIAIICVSMTGFVSWHLLLRTGEKTSAEMMLYFSIIASIFLIILLVFILLHSYRKIHVIEKMMDLARINGFVDENRFNAFGRLGTELKSVYEEVENISEKRAQRLYFMDSLTEAIFDIIDEKIIVINLQGNILYVSNKAVPKKEIFSISDATISITEILPDFGFAEVASQVSREHTAIPITIKSKSTGVCIPIYGKDNTPNGFILSFDNLETINNSINNFIERFKVEKKNTKKKSSSIKNFFIARRK